MHLPMLFQRLKAQQSSISKKVYRGYILMLLLLVTVSGATVYGVLRLNDWIDSTEKVDKLLHQIYLARIETKSYSLSSDTLHMGQVDSLTLEIEQALHKARESRLYHQSRLELEDVDQWIQDFNTYWSMFTELKARRLQSEQRMDQLFQRVFLAAREPLPRLSSAGAGGSIDPRNDLLFQLLHLKEAEKQIWNYPQSVVVPDSVRTIFQRIRLLLPPADVVAPDSRAASALRQLGSDLSAYEEVMLSLSVSIHHLQEAQDMMVESALSLQQAGERANRLQSEAMERWSALSLWFLVLILVFALGVGVFMAYRFIRRLRKDEKLREEKDRLLRENRKLLNDIINNSASLIYVKDLQGRYTLINQPMEEILGVEAHRIIGKTDDAVFPPDYAEAISRNDADVLAGGQAVQIEEFIPGADGRRIFLSNKFPIQDAEGQNVSLVCVSTDITDLRRALSELERSRENYHNIVSNVPGIVYHCHNDARRTMLFVSGGVEKLIGLGIDAFITEGQSIMPFIDAEDVHKVRETIRQAVLRQRPYEIEYRVRDLYGQRKWVYEKGLPVYEPDSTKVTLQGVIIDITAQKEAMSELMLRDRLLEGVSEAVKELIANQEPEEAMLKALRVMGEGAGVDHSFVFINERSDVSGKIAMRHVVEWDRSLLEPVRREEMADLAYESVSTTWFYRLSEKKEVVVNMRQAEQAEQLFLRRMNASGMLLQPVFVQKHFWGFIGFAYGVRGGSWNESHKTLFKAFATTLGIVLARNAGAEELHKAKEAAEAATKAKSDFLARMSHEIRTPLNAIIGWTHLGLEKIDVPGHSDYLKRIQSSSRSLLGIINDILDFSKIEAGRLELEQIDFDLEGVMQNLADIVYFRANEKGLNLVFDYAPNVPLNLVGDPLRIEQVLVNLVNNAIKFTDQGEVLVKVRVQEEKNGQLVLFFSVSDTGIGLKEEQKQNLFQAFSQADVSITRKYGGTGLGLAICKRLTSLMGGKIWVDSEYGVGSIFSFTVKLGRQSVQKKEQMVHAFEGEGDTVLIADANRSSAKSLEHMLQDFGFSVRRVNGSKALWRELERKEQTDSYRILFLDTSVFGERTEELGMLKDYASGYEHLVFLSTPFNESSMHKLAAAFGDPVLLSKPANYSMLFDCLMDVLGGGVMDAEPIGRKRVYRELLREKGPVHALVVDDTASNRSLAIELLDMAGVKAEVVSGGKEALDLARSSKGECPFDIVLMDINMPEMDGYAATRKIKRMEGWEEVPVAAMTAEAFGDVEGLCLQAGMSGMIAKPIDPEDLFRVIYRMVFGLEEEAPAPAASAVGDDVRIDFPDIEGLDVQAGIRRMGGRSDLYKRLLKGFCHDYQHFGESIQELQQSGDHETMARVLHSLKGIVGTMEAVDLYPLAIEVEAAFKAEEADFSLKLESLLVGVAQLVRRLQEEW